MPNEELNFITVALHDEDNNTLYRKDIEGDELAKLLSKEEWCNVWVEADVASKPTEWVVWPNSKENGWGQRYAGNL